MDDIQEQKQNEIGIADIFRILLKKIRLLLVVLIVGAIVGGLFGFFRYKDEKFYGSEVKYEISIRATTTFYENGVQTGDPKPDAAPNYVYKEEHLSMLVDHLNSDNFLLEILKEFAPESVVQNVTVNGEVDLDDDSVTEEAKAKFLSYMKFVSSSISYSYDHSVNPNAFSMLVSVKNDEEAAAKLLKAAKKLVQEEVSGTKDEEGNILRPGRIIVPASTKTVEGNRWAVTSYTAECDPMTINRSHELNAGYAKKKTILFAALFGLGALIVACVIAVIADNSDERLRDYESFSKSLGVPVLGVIPSIDRLSDYEYKQKHKEGKE